VFAPIDGRPQAARRASRARQLRHHQDAEVKAWLEKTSALQAGHFTPTASWLKPRRRFFRRVYVQSVILKGS